VETSRNASLRNQDNLRTGDVFREPTGPADHIFVNAQYCRGEGCPAWCCCVNTAPNAFQFDKSTGRAELKNQELTWGSTLGYGEDSDYQLERAVGQCPQQCLHFVSADQVDVLQDLFSEIASFESLDPVSLQMEIDSLLAVASFENNRWHPS